MQILWTNRAHQDLADIITYIKQQSPQNAAMMFDKIRSQVENLASFPDMGVRPNDLRLYNQGYRMLIVEKYLIFYLHNDENVIIVGIVHGAQKYAHLFA